MNVVGSWLIDARLDWSYALQHVILCTFEAVSGGYRLTRSTGSMAYDIKASNCDVSIIYSKHDINIVLISVFFIYQHETECYSNNGKTSVRSEEKCNYSYLITLSWNNMLMIVFFTSSFTALHPHAYGAVDPISQEFKTKSGWVNFMHLVLLIDVRLHDVSIYTGSEQRKS
jgi:hypothetical protein